jgi:hypothetical protein
VETNQLQDDGAKIGSCTACGCDRRHDEGCRNQLVSSIALAVVTRHTAWMCGIRGGGAVCDMVIGA